MVQKIQCSKCKGNNTIKWCKRKTENRGLIQRYKCKDCKSYFTLDEGFFRMRNNPIKITQSVDLFYRGISTRKVQEHLAVFHPHNASNVSIYNWVVKYAKMIGKFTDKLKVRASQEVQVDEMQLFRRKDYKGKLGKEENWHIDSIDPETKFLISANYVQSRNMKQIKKVLEGIRDKTANQIRIVTTDGLNAYPKQIKKVWGYNNKRGKYNVTHNKVTASKGDGFNYPIERLALHN